METSYISLDVLAARLGLPRPFLREQAQRGVIPYLCVRGRMRFEESAVRDALRREAEAGTIPCTRVGAAILFNPASAP
jgi:excisionase family DNA binding protein